MSDDDRIAKLQALLARIRARSRPVRPLASPPSRAAARPASAPLEMATPLAAFHPSPPPPPPPPPPEPEPPPSPPARTRYTSRPEVPAGLFAMRPEEPSFAQRGTESARNGSWAAYEPPPMEVVELDVDPDPSLPPPPISESSLEATNPSGPSSAHVAASRPEPELTSAAHSAPIEAPLESRSRLVSAPPSALDTFDAHDEPPVGAASDPTIEVAAAEVTRAELEALEEEQAPTSSRRPITIEEKMSELDDDVVPLHTPPPESGRHPAASPSMDLAFVEADVSVVRADPPPRADVAVFVSPPRTDLAAKTFGELLDEALSL